MPKTLEYPVTLYPAARERGFVVTQCQPFGKSYPQKAISATGLADLLRQVTDFAETHGEGCRASIRCYAKRKPPNFDKITSDLYFNLATPEDNATSASDGQSC